MQLFSSNFKLGILGGGQLGKMLLYDAKRYDLHTKVMDSNNQAPCAKIADEFIVGDITNYQDVIDFGNKVDIITVEIEKINTEAFSSSGDSVLNKISASSSIIPKKLKIIIDPTLHKMEYFVGANSKDNKTFDIIKAKFATYQSTRNDEDTLKNICSKYTK